jgi:hypothetical protein
MRSFLFLSTALLAACAAAPVSPPLAVPLAARPAQVSAPPPAQVSAPPPEEACASCGPIAIKNASKRYDFLLFLDEPWGREDEAAGEVKVFLKGTGVVVASLRVPEIHVEKDDSGAPLVNTARMYDYQGTLQVGDFDFDGNEDFAVLEGYHGPYGGPSYTVFLYSPRAKTFVLAPKLGELTHEYLGYFQVDAAKRRLFAFGKSGCCWHISEEFEVVRGEPVSVARLVEDATSGTQVEITEERLVGGKWQTKTRTEPLRP